MTPDSIRTLYGYNAWANERVLVTAAQLSPQQLAAAAGPAGESVRDTLMHTMGAQWLFLERWHGRSPTAMPDVAFPDLIAIRTRWDVIEAETRAFVAALDDARLAAVTEYTNFRGERWAYPLWQQMVHQVNHGTQHRSEAAMMLTQLGFSPGWLDFLYYIDLKATTTSKPRA